MKEVPLRPLPAALLALSLACTQHPRPGEVLPGGVPVQPERRPSVVISALPPPPAARGPLKISVIYPDSTARLEIRDSSFIFGSVGDGSATLTINGDPVPVAANGAWLAWIPFRGDSVIAFHLAAKTATDSAALTWRVRRAH